MNRIELEKKLLELGIPSGEFSIDGIKHYEATCLVHENDKWKVVYKDRSHIVPLQEFDTEKEACEFIYVKMKKDYGYIKPKA